MNQRIRMGKVQPEAYKAMLSMEKYIAGTRLQPLHKEMIRIRASQINGCSYCLDMHTRDARKLNETEQRIYLLPVWKETSLYTEEERALLALTEEMTLIQGQVSDAVYDQALSLLGEEYLAQAMMLIITINMWNRIGISCKMEPGED